MEPDPTLTPTSSPAPNSTLMEQPQVVPPAPELKKPRRKINPVAVILVVLFVGLLCGLAGLGYLAYTLNSDLKTSESNFKTLTGQFEALTAEKNTLTANFNATTAKLEATSAELETTKAELETTKGELSTAQTELEAAKSENADLLARIDLARKYVNVQVGIWSDGDSIAETRVKIKATEDERSLELFDNFMSSLSSFDLARWMSYFFDALDEVLQG